MRQAPLGIAPILIALGYLTTICLAQSPPPACSGEVSTWNECTGTQDLKDGSKYAGEFRNGQFDGKGTLTWKDGDQYVGDFKAGIRTGNGSVTLAKLAKFSGRWVDGKYVGP